MQCEALFKKIDELNERYVNVLEDICNIESPTNCKAGVDAVGEYIIKMAESRGWKVEVFEQPISGNVVCLTLNADSEEAPLSVSAHADTVHPVGSFGTPAVRREEKKLYGPGAADCKGGLVAALLAMDALDKCGFRARPVRFLMQADEETGSSTSGYATINYICEKAKDSIAFLNLEGYKKHTAVMRRKGILRFRFNVKGKAAHSAACQNGANAIAEAAHKILRLEELKDPDGTTCNCGVISGGTTANSVAETCSFTADFRYASVADADKIKLLVKEVAEHSYIEGCSCELEAVSYRPPLEDAERNYDLLRKVNEIYAANGIPTLEPRDNPGGSDAAYVTLHGIPCIDDLGVEGGLVHSVREYMFLDSLAESAKRIAAVAYCI